MAGERTSPSIPVSTNDRLLNLAEAATRLRMGQSTLRQALYEDRGPVGYQAAGFGPLALPAQRPRSLCQGR